MTEGLGATGSQEENGKPALVEHRPNIRCSTGSALDNPVLRSEGRVTAIDGILAISVLVGLILNAALGWWWADPAAGHVLAHYGPERRMVLSPTEPLVVPVTPPIYYL